MDNQPLVSIIIVNFNGEKYLGNCFDSLYRGTYKNIEIIFVDNGSGDGSLEFIRSNYKDVRILDNGNNLGLAIASNRGAELARGKYLFFYNNDTIAEQDLIYKLVEALEKDPRIGIGGCSTYTYDGKHLINAGVPCDIFGYPYGKGEPFYADAAIFISRDLFYRIGKFDEKMFLYGEDRDLCWRCWLYGYKVAIIDGANFFHDSACIKSDIRQYRTNIHKRYLGEFNALRSILKNYSLLFLTVVLPMYMLINLAELTIFLFSGRFSVIKDAYLKSYLENFCSLKEIFYLRAKIQKERKVADLTLMRRMTKVPGKIKLFFSLGLPKFNEESKYLTTPY